MARFNKQSSSSTKTGDIRKSVSQLNTQGVLLSAPLAQSIYSAESYTQGLSSSDQAQYSTAMENIQNALTRIATTHGIPVGNNITCAMEAYAAARAPAEFMTAPANLTDVISSDIPQGSFITIDNPYGKPERVLSIESFDETATARCQEWSVAYNFAHAKQEPVAEMFFKTIVMSPDLFGYTVTVRLNLLMQAIQRNANGTPDDLRKSNVLDTFVDPSALRNNQTDCIPLVSDANAQYLAAPADIAPRTVTIGVGKGINISTAPLVCGQTINLIGVSTVPALIANQVMDQTDQLDPNIVLTKIYVKITDGSKTEFIPLDTSLIQGAYFTASTQGNFRDMTLKLSTQALALTKDLKTAAGTASAVLAGIGNVAIRMNLTVTGESNLEYGNIMVNHGAIQFHSAFDRTTGVPVTDATTLAAIKSILATASTTHYDVDARRTNSNRRQIGNLIDTTYVTQVYGLPLLPAIASQRPLPSTYTPDTSTQVDGDLVALTQLTYAKMSADGIAKLMEQFDIGKRMQASGALVQDSVAPQALGMGRYFLKNVFYDDNMPVTDIVNSLTSTARIDDVRAAMANVIRAQVVSAVRESRMPIALAALQRSPNIKILLATDVQTANYLQITGDTRLFGPGLEVQIETTMNQALRDQIIVSLTPSDDLGDNVFDVLRPGHTLYRPELVWQMARQTGNTATNVMAVQPSYRHVANHGVWLRWNVSDLLKAVSEKLAINFKNVP